MADLSNRQLGLLPLDHDSLQPHRLRKFGRTNPERIYAAHWKDQNRRRGGINSGAGILEWILSPRGNTWVVVSRRDAAVAASVIQWLGTNVGLGFILTCERKIEQLKRSERERRARPSLAEAQREEGKPAVRRLRVRRP